MAEKIIQNPSITSGAFTIDDGKIVAIAGMPLAGSGGGTQSDFVYVPSFNSETGDISFILGVTGTEGKGPWHISGTPGPKGADGAQGEPGEDACPITATSTEIEDGVHVAVSYTSGGNALTEFDIYNGYNGETPEFSANPVNAHLLWKYSDDSNWTDFGFAMSGEKGPQGPEGPEGPEGPNGISPTVTVTNIPADPTDPDHKNGGTEITITDATTTNKFSAWNGNDGTMAGAPDIEGKNGISAALAGSTYEVGLSAAFYNAVTSVSSKLNESDFTTYTATTAPGAFQPKGDYLTTVATSGSIIGTGLATNKIGLVTSAENALTAVGNKVDKPDTTQTDLNNKYLVYSTLSAEGAVTGWTDFNANVYSKSDSDGRYQKKTDMSSYLTTAQYETDSATFVTETELETVSGEITALIPTNYVTSGDYISGTKQYALTSAGWAEVQDGSISLPVNIGSNNTITGNSLGAIGNNNIVGEKSMTFSIVGSVATSNSFAFGDENYTSANSLVAGWKSSATDYSIAVGHNNGANINSVAFASDNSAYNYSFAAGHANTASNYSMAYGRGLAIQGATLGGLAIGGWNKTSANPLFVVGNGTGNGNNRSDALVIDTTGNTHMYRPMSVEYANGQNVLAVASAATLIGASRQTPANYGVNNTAIGTTWMGVGGPGMHQGFIKYTDGGDVGALDSNSMIQLNFKPSTNKFDSIEVNINNNSVGYLIPAVTATTTAGLTDDGILHIIVEN